MNTIQFGYHLTLDLYNCDHKLLNDMEYCYNSLLKMAKILKMKVLTPPFVVSASGNEKSGGKDPGGFSGFLMIYESHISLHTFVKRGFASVDVYSCKEFDEKSAIKHFKEFFNSRDEEINFIKRGSKYPSKNIH